MLIFFFLLTIYSSANLYLFYKLNSLINLGTGVDVLIGAVVFFMTISPVLIPVYSNIGSERSIRLFSYIGYMWLGFLVIFFPASVIIDIYNLAMPLIDDGYGLIMVSSKISFIVSMLLAFLINVYGFYEARNLCIERLVIKTPKLPYGVERIRIAQISDLHLGIILGDGMVKNVIQKIANEAPDIIVSTGDLIDGTIRHIEHLPERLKELYAPLGKFAIMGNHEIYGDKSLTIKFIKDSGFRLLRNESVTAGDVINIAGMDFTGGEVAAHENAGHKLEHEVLAGLQEGLFTLMLKHKSDVNDESLGLFDLQLSGHTHGGQIFPMNLATMFIFSYHSGFVKLAKGSAIYTSRGTGTAGPPIRFLSRPEITIIDIVKT
ncbi:putative metallophosphoesterase [bacterium BMS3Bbin09]|nr:putative metallophosphoesterase [bacterium BMS3Bbin09]